jgi:hypothetical protein
LNLRALPGCTCVSPPRARYRETIARAVADIKNKARAVAASDNLAAS